MSLNKIFNESTIFEQQQNIKTYLEKFFPNVITDLISEYAYFLKDITYTFKGHDGAITCLAILPDGRFASGSTDSTLKIWNPTKQMLKKDQTFFKVIDKITYDSILIGHSKRVNCVDVFPDNIATSTSTIRIISGSDDSTLKIWNINKEQHQIQYKINSDITLVGHTDSVTCVKILPDGKIISGSSDYTLKIWNLQAIDTKYCENTFEHHYENIQCITIFPDHNCCKYRIISGSNGSTVSTLKILDQKNWKYSLSIQHSNITTCVSVLSDLCRIVTGSCDRTLKIFNLDTPENILTLTGHTRPTSCVDILPDGKIISGSYDETLKIWNQNTGKCELT